MRKIIDFLWATNVGRTTEPSVARAGEGWKGYPDVPDAKVQNYLDNRTTELLDHVSKYGVCEWTDLETYPINGLCLYNGIIYKSLQNTNINKNPSSQPAWWSSDIIPHIITTRGDLIRGDSSGNPERLAVGTAGKYLKTDGTDAFWDDPPGVPSASVSSEGIGYYNKHWMWGFIPKSGATPDEQVTITGGKAICKDGSTIVELTATATNLSLPALNGGPLANNTTYHLVRYKKNDNTMQWDLDASLTPTIGDIKSVLAYRRILSLKTDSSGDITEFTGEDKGSGTIKIIYRENFIETITSVALSNIAISTPGGINVDALMLLQARDPTNVNYVAVKPVSGSISNVNIIKFQSGPSGIEIFQNGIIPTDASSQIRHGILPGGVGAPPLYSLETIGFIDYRNRF